MHGPNPNTSLLTVCNFILIFERTNDRGIKPSLRYANYLLRFAHRSNANIEIDANGMKEHTCIIVYAESTYDTNLRASLLQKTQDN